METPPDNIPPAAFQKSLCLDGKGIRRIMEAPRGLETLSVSGNRLKQLGAIASCTGLLEINLSSNKLEETALLPLAAFPVLRSLNVARNQLKGLERLFLASRDAFPKLEHFDVSRNEGLRDVGPAFVARGLRTLRAAGTALTALVCRSSPGIEVLDLRGCSIGLFENLASLPSLRELLIDGNALLACDAFASHPLLKTLRLAHNAISQVCPLRLPSLAVLDLTANHLTEAPVLAGVGSLASLSLRENALVSLLALAPLRSLTFLDASHNNIVGLESGLSVLVKSLQVLILSSNAIRAAEDILDALQRARQPRLQHLDLRDNPVSFAFYPSCNRSLPTWTWEACKTLAQLERGGKSGPELDARTWDLRGQYRAKLACACPSLLSLDGVLVAPHERVASSFDDLRQEPLQDSPPQRVETIYKDQDEVNYGTGSVTQSGERERTPRGQSLASASGSAFAPTASTGSQTGTLALASPSASSSGVVALRERSRSREGMACIAQTAQRREAASKPAAPVASEMPRHGNRERQDLASPCGPPAMLAPTTWTEAGTENAIAPTRLGRPGAVLALRRSPRDSPGSPPRVADNAVGFLGPVPPFPCASMDDGRVAPGELTSHALTISPAAQRSRPDLEEAIHVMRVAYEDSQSSLLNASGISSTDEPAGRQAVERLAADQHVGASIASEPCLQPPSMAARTHTQQTVQASSSWATGSAKIPPLPGEPENAARSESRGSSRSLYCLHDATHRGSVRDGSCSASPRSTSELPSVTWRGRRSPSPPGYARFLDMERGDPILARQPAHEPAIEESDSRRLALMDGTSTFGTESRYPASVRSFDTSASTSMRVAPQAEPPHSGTVPPESWTVPETRARRGSATQTDAPHPASITTSLSRRPEYGHRAGLDSKQTSFAWRGFASEVYADAGSVSSRSQQNMVESLAPSPCSVVPAPMSAREHGGQTPGSASMGAWTSTPTILDEERPATVATTFSPPAHRPSSASAAPDVWSVLEEAAGLDDDEEADATGRKTGSFVQSEPSHGSDMERSFGTGTCWSVMGWSAPSASQTSSQVPNLGTPGPGAAQQQHRANTGNEEVFTLSAPGEGFAQSRRRVASADDGFGRRSISRDLRITANLDGEQDNWPPEQSSCAGLTEVTGGSRKTTSEEGNRLDATPCLFGPRARVPQATMPSPALPDEPCRSDALPHARGCRVADPLRAPSLRSPGKPQNGKSTCSEEAPSHDLRQDTGGVSTDKAGVSQASQRFRDSLKNCTKRTEAESLSGDAADSGVPSGRDAYLRFLEQEIAAQHAILALHRGVRGSGSRCPSARARGKHAGAAPGSTQRPRSSRDVDPASDRPPPGFASRRDFASTGGTSYDDSGDSALAAGHLHRFSTRHRGDSFARRQIRGSSGADNRVTEPHVRKPSQRPSAERCEASKMNRRGGGSAAFVNGDGHARVALSPADGGSSVQKHKSAAHASDHRSSVSACGSDSFARADVLAPHRADSSMDTPESEMNSSDGEDWYLSGCVRRGSASGSPRPASQGQVGRQSDVKSRIPAAPFDEEEVPSRSPPKSRGQRSTAPSRAKQVLDDAVGAGSSRGGGCQETWTVADDCTSQQPQRPRTDYVGAAQRDRCQAGSSRLSSGEQKPPDQAASTPTDGRGPIPGPLRWSAYAEQNVRITESMQTPAADACASTSIPSPCRPAATSAENPGSREALLRAPGPKRGALDASAVAKGIEEVSEFSSRTPAVPTAMLRNVKVTVDDGCVASQPPAEDHSRMHQDNLKKSDSVVSFRPDWPQALKLGVESNTSLLGLIAEGSLCGKQGSMTVVTPVQPGVRQALEELLEQQTWSVPGKPLCYRYTLGRVVQAHCTTARASFEVLAERDVARAGLTPARGQGRSFGQTQNAFFCDDPQMMARVISSPSGFSAAFEGMVLLFALDLRYAEALSSACDWAPCACGASAPKLFGRTLLTEVALGHCFTAECTLQDAIIGSAPGSAEGDGCRGAVPMGPAFEDAYRRGADSLYFPQPGIIALLSTARALPLFLAEYRRQRVRLTTPGGQS